MRKVAMAAALLTLMITRDEVDVSMLVCFFEKRLFGYIILLAAGQHGSFSRHHFPSIGALDEGARLVHSIGVRVTGYVCHLRGEFTRVLCKRIGHGHDGECFPMTLDGSVEIIEAMQDGGYGIVIDRAVIACGVPAEPVGAVEELEFGGEAAFAYFEVVGIEHRVDLRCELFGFAFGEACVGVSASGDCCNDEDE